MPSIKILEEKKQVVSKLSEKFKQAKSIIFADYRGLTVSQDTEMRTELRRAGVEYKVVKNSITKFALKDNNISELDEFFNSPTAVAMSYDDPVAPAKVLTQFTKKFKEISIKIGIVDGKVVNIDGIKALAELPPKEVLISRVLGGFKAPINGFANVLNGNLRGLVIVLNAIAESKTKAEA